MIRGNELPAIRSAALAVLAIAGCSSLFGWSDPTVRLRFSVASEVDQLLHLEVVVDGELFSLEESEETVVEVRRSGTLPVSVTLLSSTDTLAQDAFDQ